MRGPMFVAAVLIASAGCGLADYEKRMDEKREQLRLFDEENALLGNMIDMPRGKDAYGNDIKVPFAIFVRLPKGIGAAFKGPEAVYYGDKQPLYRYYGTPDVNIFLALAKVRQKTSGDDGKPAEGEAAPADFRARVRKGLMDFITREYKGSIGANVPEFDQLKETSRKTVRNGREATLRFDALEFNDPRVQNPSRFYVFVQTTSYRQAAIIYQRPTQQANQDWLKTMDVSLKTLEITEAAISMRNAFGSR